MVRDYHDLEVFKAIMRDPRWKDLFDLVARAISGLLSDRTTVFRLALGTHRAIVGMDVPVGITQLYFDGTFKERTLDSNLLTQGR